MKKFEFSLQTVLSLRESEEREWENELAAVTGECVKIRREIEHYGMEKSRCAEENTFRDINSLMAVSNYQSLMDKKSEEAGKRLAMKEREREKVLKDFIEASKKRKILDKLKEKQKDEYHYLRNKHEEKMTDDLNNSRRIGRI